MSSKSDLKWSFRVTLWLAYLIARVLVATWRVRIVSLENRRKAESLSPSGSFILATFHENAIAGVLSHPGQGIACLASRSKDGEFVAFICEKYGLRSVRGSSSRGGAEARNEMIQLLKSGVSAAITVDGPRGPRRIAKAGIIDTARKSGSWVMPITSIGSRQFVLRKTWDQTRIPKPFSRVLVRYGEPIFIPPETEGLEFEKIQAKMSEILTLEDDLTREKFEELWIK